MSGNNVFDGGSAFAQANIAVPESESLMAPGPRHGWGGQDETNFLTIKHSIAQKKMMFIIAHRYSGEAPITSLMSGLAMALNSCACLEQMPYGRFETWEVGSKYMKRGDITLFNCQPLCFNIWPFAINRGQCSVLLARTCQPPQPDGHESREKRMAMAKFPPGSVQENDNIS